MRRYLLDTNILVHYARASVLYQTIEQNERLTNEDCLPMISVVSNGEIISFGIQNQWASHKILSIQKLLSKLVIIDINSSDSSLLNSYAEIDSYSKNKLHTQKLGRSISMGKNDIWIAATAKVADAILLTLDNDFDHLNGTYLTVRKY